MKSYDLSGNLTKCTRPKNGYKWQYHHGMADQGYWVYFKTKKTADEFVRHSNKFVKNMFMQSNQVYSDLFVLWRSVYMHYEKSDRDVKKIIDCIEQIDFQFNRWTKWHTYGSGDFACWVFRAPQAIQGQLRKMTEILRAYAKRQSNTAMVYQLDSKLSYLNFLELQYRDFEKYSREGDNIAKIINLPILQIMAS